ncbi:MAG TPA: hypothetical protein VN821_05290 [Candidatus Udaeobacter sp.]|nr:hypothetical protein [Candidatus Udaeobacter sp.]
MSTFAALLEPSSILSVILNPPRRLAIGQAILRGSDATGNDPNYLASPPADERGRDLGRVLKVVEKLRRGWREREKRDQGDVVGWLSALILQPLLIPSGKFRSVLLLVDPFPGFGLGVECVDDPRLCAWLRHFDIAGPPVFPNDDSVSVFRHDLNVALGLRIANRLAGRSRSNLVLLTEAREGREATQGHGREEGRRWEGDFPVAERKSVGSSIMRLPHGRSSCLWPRRQVKN